MDIQIAILQAKKSAGENDLVTAQKILKKVISQEPKNVDAWLTLAEVVQKPEVAEKCLRQVLKIDPGNQDAQQRLQKYQSTHQDSDLRRGEPKPAAQSLDERLQSFAQPSMEMDDPWEIPAQTTSPPRPAAPGVDAPSTPKQNLPITHTQLSKPKRSGRWLEFSLIGVLCVMASMRTRLVSFHAKKSCWGS